MDQAGIGTAEAMPEVSSGTVGCSGQVDWREEKGSEEGGEVMEAAIWIVAVLLAVCVWLGAKLVSQLAEIAGLICLFHNELMPMVAAAVREKERP